MAVYECLWTIIVAVFRELPIVNLWYSQVNAKDITSTTDKLLNFSHKNICGDSRSKWAYSASADLISTEFGINLIPKRSKTWSNLQRGSGKMKCVTSLRLRGSLQQTLGNKTRPRVHSSANAGYKNWIGPDGHMCVLWNFNVCRPNNVTHL